MDRGKLLKPIADAYHTRLKRCGISPAAVFWNDGDGQTLRYELLLSVMDVDIHRKSLSINDLGCGYGAFFELLEDMPPMIGGSYRGYDICPSMIKAAKRRIKDTRAQFFESAAVSQTADYAFASGTYNMKGRASDEQWGRYVKQSLSELWTKSAKGLAFNMLDGTKKKKREDWLYYPDAEEYLDFCRANLSPNAKLMDSDPLAEWTMLVRR